MKINQILNEDGRIVKGVNTTVDVQPGETERQAAKFFGYNQNLLKKQKAKDPVNTLYNLGLVNESHELTWERVVKQSNPLRVLDIVSTRNDPSAFPVKMYDGSTIGVTPMIARRIMDVYDDVDDAKKQKIEWFLKTKNGFRQLAQIVAGKGVNPRVAGTEIKDSVQQHVEEAWRKK